MGQADCTGDLLVCNALGLFQIAYDVAWDNRGSARIDLAKDGCTMSYTSQGPNIKRFNVCTHQQLPDFNVAPITSGDMYTYGLRILPHRGVLVATLGNISRLDATGKVLSSFNAGTPTTTVKDVLVKR